MKKFTFFTLMTCCLINSLNAQQSDSTNQTLFKAAASGNIIQVKELLSKKANPNYNAKHGLTPLIISAYAGHHQIVTLLLKAGADANHLNKDKESALVASAAATRPTTIVRTLLSYKANPALADKYGRTALIVHAMMGHTQSVALLLKASAKVNALDNQGQNPVFSAALHGHLTTVKLLIKHGADYKKANKNNFSPLMAACVRGHEKVMHYLISQGANPLRTDVKGNTCMVFALATGRWTAIQTLLDGGIKLSTPISKQGAILHTAIVDRNYKVINKLLKMGAPINQLAPLSPLMWTVAIKDPQLAKLLITAGAKVDLKTHNGTTALLLAAITGNLELVKLLLEHGAKIDQTNPQGGTALRAAASAGHLDVVKYLTEKGAHTHTQDIFKLYPIDYAKRGGHTKIVNYLKQQINK